MHDDAGRERDSVTTDDQMDDVVVPHPAEMVQPGSRPVRHDDAVVGKTGGHAARLERVGSGTEAVDPGMETHQRSGVEVPAHGARTHPVGLQLRSSYHSMAQPDEPTELSRNNEHDIPLLTSSVRGKVCDSTAETPGRHTLGRRHATSRSADVLFASSLTPLWRERCREPHVCRLKGENRLDGGPRAAGS